MKDCYSSKSLFTRIREAIKNQDYETVSNLQIEMESKMSELRELYSDYARNLLDI